MTQKKILFYCQHSIGVGHLVRSFTLVSSLSKSFQVSLISGGQFPQAISIPEGVEFIQLPPIGLNQNNCLEAIGSDEPVYQIMKQRQKILINIYKKLNPDFFITEFFPLGKIQFMGELIPVLRLIKNVEKHTRVVCSLRDVLEPSFTDGKLGQDFGIKIINEHYDAILVHGDKDFITLDKSFPKIERINAPIFYTGYVSKLSYQPDLNREGFSEIVLSAGGGKIAHPFVTKIVNSFIRYGFGENTQLRIIAGPMYPLDQFKELENSINNRRNITLHFSVRNISEYWKNAKLSISPGGYNTLMELISSRIPALVCPYRNETNSEQEFRSSILEQKGLIKMMFYEDISEKEIAQMVVKALSFAPSHEKINIAGARQTRKILQQLVQ